MADIIDKLKVYKTIMKNASIPLFDGVMVCKLTGVTYDNRQSYLEKVEETTKLRLERDRRNDYDFHAVKVMAEISGQWEDVGFVPSKVNKIIAQALDSGVKLRAKVWKLTGGQDGFYRGLSITIARMI